MIEVVAPGTLTSVQDAGRRGLAHLGVPPSGAADQRALALANRLVGNAPGRAALEITLIGPRLRFCCDATVAVTGAPIDATVGDRPLAMNAPERVAAGQTVCFGIARAGLRSYVAVRGGLVAPQALGSSATDTLTGLGPAPLRVADRLTIGGDPDGPMPGVDVAAVPQPAEHPLLRLVLGPRDDWFCSEAVDALLEEPFAVDPSSNRIGLRLRGPRLRRANHAELLSEGVIAGSLQVPPGGQPILLLRDHPVTGGYPVIAVVVADDLAVAAQLRPGRQVRFRLAG